MPEAGRPSWPALCARVPVLALLAALAWLHLSQKIFFMTADLGRHIRNGELFFQAHQVLATNFYSYTHPDLPTICHHWGAGALFYLIWAWGGFMALSAFYAGLLVVTGALFMAAGRRLAGFWPLVLMAVLALPALSQRVEIRPEGLSTFFLGAEFLLLMEYRAACLPRRWLWALPCIQLLWVNTHILFFTGFVLVGFFVIDAFMNDRERSRWRALAGAGAVSVAVSLLNPFGVAGVLEPLNIFREYGYMLAENQSLFFMMQRFPGSEAYGWTLAMVLAGAGLFAARFFRSTSRGSLLLEGVVFLFFSLMALKMVRSIAMFAFFFIPLAAIQLTQVVRSLDGAWRAWCQRAVVLAAAGLVGLASLEPRFFLSPLRRPYLALGEQAEKYRRSLLATLFHPLTWGGLQGGIGASADFFRAQGLRGPVFNNYDIGGYFIYYLFPHARPFVDNRPEAYPAKFFTALYAPMQADEDVWNAALARYGFEVIYFYRHDQTESAQPFLVRRLDDPAWAPVFVDGYALILVRRGGVNQAVVDRFELPRSMFSVRK